ncbi:hypothetical protein N7474_003366 [Penicillium riverlandense]|uniref:uncharacterized protein n=1 Tax=Penicillium riverlandense TaxID=1903569 RepID=UPI002548D02C|nr:uncharacterized protein N7474_003366 [Penicillium riverlandense]KAJ5826228.1 hypothetical protein N7474_003366 [Penicillium riverlandense]
MGAIPEADPDETIETKPFKFVTGYDARFPQMNQYVHSSCLYLATSNSASQDQALLAELRRLLQVRHRKGRGLPPVPSGMYLETSQ